MTACLLGVVVKQYEVDALEVAAVTWDKAELGQGKYCGKRNEKMYDNETNA